MLLFFALFVPLKHAKGLNSTNINLAISTKTKKKTCTDGKVWFEKRGHVQGKKRAYGCPNVN
jgi:hypothetical protein